MAHARRLADVLEIELGADVLEIELGIDVG
jgi:hypothetical protein